MRSKERKPLLNLSLGQKGLVLVGLPLLFELIFVGMLAFLVKQAEMEATLLARSKDKVATANIITKLFINAGASLAAYSIQKNPTLAEQYEVSLEQIPVEIIKLKRLCSDNARQVEIVAHIDGITADGINIVRKLKSVMDSRPNSQLTILTQNNSSFRKLNQQMSDLEAEVDEFMEEERRLTRARPQVESRARHLVHIVLWTGTVLNVLLAMIVAHLFYTGVNARLRVLIDNTIRLARSEPLRPIMAGTDEVAVLDRVFHEMADALAEAVRKERAIVENALDVICSIDEDSKFTAVSPASVHVWGYSPEELIGKSFTDLLHPDDVESTRTAINSIKTDSVPVPFENRIRRKTEGTVQVLWSAYWSSAERSMFCVAHDITERKRTEELLRESEARTRSIIESMPVGLIIVDDAGIIDEVNPHMEKIFRCQKHELIGQPLCELFPRIDELSPDNIAKLACDKQTGRLREFNAQRKTGEVFPAEISLMKYQTSGAPRFLINVIDVTERHFVEKLKREFVTTVSHELRTPLTSIRGSLTLLAVGALGPLAEQAHRAVKIAERNCLRLVCLLNDLLDMEKLEAGKMEMVFERMSLAPVIERSVESVRSFADQYDIQIEVEGPELEVSADADRIIQVMINLLSNGCKYSPPGAILSVIVTEEISDVRVSVKDCGRGIPESALGTVFERFHQVEAADAKAKGGTGLGLAICKAIVEQHNGTIGVESQPGQGSTFWFRLPKWGTPAAPGTAERLDEIDITGTAVYKSVENIEIGQRN